MFLIFYKGKFPVLKKYLLISFKWAGMSKNLFLILFCICVTIENWAMRQRTNVDKLVICNFCTQNHLKMAKICILRPKNANFVQSNHPGPIKKQFFDTSCMCIETYKGKKVTFKNFLKYLFLGVLAVFEPFQIIVGRGGGKNPFTLFTS